MEQGHKTHGGDRKNDGAGRHGHNESGHMSHSEHKAPRHPGGSHTVQGYIPASEGVAGHPGDVLKLAHDGGKLIGGNYNQADHEPAVLKTPDGQGFTAGHPGIHAGMGSGSHGFGHQGSQRKGNLRTSGHSGAHQIGKR
jgi:hypothetical protein